MAQHVVVTPYRPQWADCYEQEAARIRTILGKRLVAIHHIGSTAVPGLCAKPVIDIMPVVDDVTLIDPLFPLFEEAGYECLGEFGIPGRRYFRKGGDERTHQVHIFAQSNHRDIDRHLAVRDYLRTHAEEAAAYGTLKTALAQRYPYDIEGYCDGKEAFVRALEAKALLWAQTGR